MPESIRRKEHKVHREAGDAVEGDQILIECRKPGKWQTVRGSERKNAYAVIVKRFANVGKG